MDEEQHSWPVASQVDLNQNHQPKEKSDSVAFEPQPEVSSSIDQDFESHGMMNTLSEQEEQSSESIPPETSQNFYAIADATQQNTVIERPSSSIPGGCFAQTYSRTRVDIAKSDNLPEEQDNSREREERSSNVAKHSAVTIMVGAR
jgi:hypothetical protein